MRSPMLDPTAGKRAREIREHPGAPQRIRIRPTRAMASLSRTHASKPSTHSASSTPPGRSTERNLIRRVLAPRPQMWASATAQGSTSTDTGPKPEQP